jgi:hypothetical protein
MEARWAGQQCGESLRPHIDPAFLVWLREEPPAQKRVGAASHHWRTREQKMIRKVRNDAW